MKYIRLLSTLYKIIMIGEEGSKRRYKMTKVLLMVFLLLVSLTFAQPNNGSDQTQPGNQTISLLLNQLLDLISILQTLIFVIILILILDIVLSVLMFLRISRVERTFPQMIEALISQKGKEAVKSEARIVEEVTKPTLSPIESKICPHCGAELPLGEIHVLCPFCGRRLR